MFLYFLIISSVIILQSTLFTGLSIGGARPDFALLFLIFFSHLLGPMEGKIMGFAGGLVKDSLSLAPFGFHAVIDMTVGHVFGFSKEKMYLDSLTLPLILAIVATLIKSIWSFLLFALFLPEKLSSDFGTSLLVELGINAIAAPFIFALIRILRLAPGRSRTMFK